MSALIRSSTDFIPASTLARSSASSEMMLKLSSSFVRKAPIASVRPSITARRVTGVEIWMKGS